jgi:diguanylate cyclase (GGDEF)-like protein
MQNERDSYRELDTSWRKLEELTGQVEKNMEIFRRSQERELELLRAPDLAVLFRKYTQYLRRSYALESVTVVVADPDHELRHLLQAGSRCQEEIADVHFVEALTGITPRYTALEKPWTGPFLAADHQMLFPGGKGLGSIAIVPLVHQGTLFGSINFGSADRQRFTRQHATDFLAHLGVIATFALENVVNRARLVRSGFTDVLTGWHNRAYLDTRLKEEIVRTERERTALVCLLLDVDHFKRVNDQYGHAAGDTVLREVALRVGAEIRRSDVSARYGGEEFIVLLPRTGIETGRLLALRIRDAVSARRFGVGVFAEPLAVTVSIGLAEYRPEGRCEATDSVAQELVARADKALYEAKAGGRNAVALAAA